MLLSPIIANIQAKMLTLGIVAAPNNLPESLNQFPFALTYPSDVEADIGEGNASWKTGSQTIVTEVHWSRENLPTAVSQSVDFAEAFFNKILGDPNLSGTVMVVERIHGKYGYLLWGDKENAHIGWRFELTVLMHDQIA